MENYYYTKALSLYNQGDYEGALNMLKASTVHSKEEESLMKECKNQIVRQYVYLIKDAISQSDYQVARKWKDEYITKYGYSDDIDSIEIPAIIVSQPEKEVKLPTEEDSLVEEKDTVRVEKKEEIISSEKIFNKEEKIIPPSQKKSFLKPILFSTLFIILVVIGIFGGKIVIDKNEKAKIETRLEEIKTKEGAHLITVLNNIAYYFEDDKLSYNKYNLETTQIEENVVSTDESLSYISEAYYAEDKNCIIFIASTGSFFKMEFYQVYKLDLETNDINEICSGEKIKHSTDYFIVTSRELVVEGDCMANNQYEWYDEYFDYNGNLIDGKMVRGRGYIDGKYPIEMSFHSIKGKVSGWYKYGGHTNYMEIRGDIQSDNSFTFTEYNEEGDAFGTFTGTVDFGNQKIDGTFTNETRGQKLAFWIDELSCSAQDKLIEWNNLHTSDKAMKLGSLYASTVSFYGQDLSRNECAKLVKSTIDKYIFYSQTLGSTVTYTRIDPNTVRLDFTKNVTTNGNNRDYDAYLVFQRMDDKRLVIIKESDTQTDAYFERNK